MYFNQEAQNFSRKEVAFLLKNLEDLEDAKEEGVFLPFRLDSIS